MINELAALIKEIAYEKRKVILASGKESDFYVDLRAITLHPKGLYLTSHLLFDLIINKYSSVKAVGGPTLGADPIVAGIALVSEMKKHPLFAFIIRKEPKKHGLSKMIEGEKNLMPSCPVVIVEDVVTSGASSFKAYSIAKDAGLNVLGIVAILDREEGAKEFFDQNNITFFSLLKKSDILG